MKKLLALLSLLLLVCICLSMASCGGSSNSSSGNSGSYSGGSSTLSIQERKDKAENYILSEVLRMMRQDSTISSKYDVDSTRYKTGKIENNGNTFTVYLTLYLYDNYGKLKGQLEMTPKIEIDEKGNIGSCTGHYPYSNKIKSY